MASDPVDDAMSAAAGQYAPQSSDPVGDAMAAAAAGKSTTVQSQDKGSFSPLQAGLSTVTGTLASVGAGYQGLWDLATGQGLRKAAQDIKETQARFTTGMNPRTQEVMASPYNPLTWPGRVGKGVGDVIQQDTGSPLLATLADTGVQAFGANEEFAAAGDLARGAGSALGAGTRAVGTGVDAVRNFVNPPLSPQEIVNRTAQSSPLSTSAAATAPNLQGTSPQLQQAVVEAANKTGGAVNVDALANHIEAEQHGVQLMEGQATRDPTTFSNEQNSTNPAIMKRRVDQEQQMTDALDNIRQEAGPTTVQNNPIQNGQIAVDALKAYDQPIKADISAKYKALTDANGGSVPLDTGQFLSNVDAQLKKQYLTDSVPPAAKSLLNSLRDGEPLDFEGFEAARTRLAEAQRNGGSEAAASGIIRNQLEQLPLSPQAAGLKGLANSARAAAKARFDALDADPAYQAAVNDSAKVGAPSPLADKFLDKYALGAPKANLDLMMSKLGPEAQQAVASHALSTIRDSAITPNGTVSANGYNRALQKLGPKLKSLVSPDTQNSLESLGRVITNAKVPPPGNFVNYSKSGVLRNAATGVAQEIGGAAINAKTMGLGMPVIKGIAERNFAKRVLAPGAGLSKLSDIVSPTQPTP
jgi:hypothetical protein